MQLEQIQHLAEALYERIQSARGVVGVYYDSTGTFRISPVRGIRYQQIQESFPESIIGAYTKQIEFDDFFEDFDFFCMQMGAYD